MIDASANRGHQPDDTSAWGVALFAATLTVSLLIVWLASGALIWGFERVTQRASLNAAPAPGEFASQGHWLHARETLTAMRAKEDQRLHTSGWIDRDHGVTHIPIEQAMESLARTGWPPESAATPGTTAPANPREQAR